MRPVPSSQRVALRFNVGPSAPIETITGAINDLNTVCQFGGQLQDMGARNVALRALVSGGVPWLRDEDLFDRSLARRPYYPPWPWEPLASPDLERQIANYLGEYDLDNDGLVLVERLTYANPVDVTLVTASGGVVLALLRLVRDWPSRRRVASAQARIAEAQADDYEDQVALRKEARAVIRRGLLTGDLPLRPDQIDRLLTDDVVDSAWRLASAEPTIRDVSADE